MNDPRDEISLKREELLQDMEQRIADGMSAEEAETLMYQSLAIYNEYLAVNAWEMWKISHDFSDKMWNIAKKRGML